MALIKEFKRRATAKTKQSLLCLLTAFIFKFICLGSHHPRILQSPTKPNTTSFKSSMADKMIPEQPIIVETPMTKRDSFQSGVPQQPADDGLVASARTSQRVHSDRLQKIWQQINRKEPKQPKQPLPPKLQKRQISMATPMNKQTSEVQKKKTQFNNVSERAAQHLTQLIEIYKFRNCNRFYIDATEKIRSDLKERVVSYLLYAIEELREVHGDLTAKEMELVEMADNEAIAQARRIAIEMEIGLIKFYNKDLRGKIQRNYRDRANTILINIRDENNLQLRRKVINGTIDPSKLATVDEIQLFTQARRDQISAKARQQIAQTTMSVFEQVVQPDEITYNDIKQPQNKVEKVVESKPKNLDQKISKQLRELMTKQTLEFKQKISDDLPEKQANILIDNLKEVFVKEYSS